MLKFQLQYLYQRAINKNANCKLMLKVKILCYANMV